MEKNINLQDFISALKNRTNEKGKGILLKHSGKPIAVLMTYDDYLHLVSQIK